MEIKTRPIFIFLLTVTLAWNIALIHGHVKKKKIFLPSNEIDQDISYVDPCCDVFLEVEWKRSNKSSKITIINKIIRIRI